MTTVDEANTQGRVRIAMLFIFIFGPHNDTSCSLKAEISLNYMRSLRRAQDLSTSQERKSMLFREHKPNNKARELTFCVKMAT